MNRIASILTGLSLAVLFFVASAQAQSDGQRVTANIPFEFTVGKTSFLAGQYEFRHIGAAGNIIVVRDLDGRSRFTMATATTQESGFPEKSLLKFVTVDGRHVLVQIWQESTASVTDVGNGRTSVALAESPTIH